MTDTLGEPEDNVAILRRLKDAEAEHERLREAGRTRSLRSDKFAGAIGMDDEGNMFDDEDTSRDA